MNREVILKFISILVEIDVKTNLIILGDSVSIQLFRFLLCDLIRSGIPLVNNGHIFSQSPNYTELKIAPKFLKSSSSSNDKVSKSGTLRLQSLQINLPCVDRNDGFDLSIDTELSQRYSRLCISNNITDKEKASYLYTRYILKHFALVSHNITDRTYIIWNYGLHVKSNQLWAIKGMTRGLFDEAVFIKSKNKNITLLYRETSSQVFSSVPGKKYLFSF